MHRQAVDQPLCMKGQAMGQPLLGNMSGKATAAWLHERHSDNVMEASANNLVLFGLKQRVTQLQNSIAVLRMALLPYRARLIRCGLAVIQVWIHPII